MSSKKPLAIVLGLALVLSAAPIVTTNTVTEASAISDLRTPIIINPPTPKSVTPIEFLGSTSSIGFHGTPTVIVLDPLPG